MSEKKKEIILKGLIVIFAVSLVGVFLFVFTIKYFTPEPEKYYYIPVQLLNVAFAASLVFAILLPVFGGLKQKPVKAEKFQLNFKTYSDFISFINDSLVAKGYSTQYTKTTNEIENVAVYIKSTKLWEIDCVSIIRVDELSDNLIESANDLITEIFTEYYGKSHITDTVNMISIICVDRITPAFNDLVHNNIQQGLKNRRLPVGISFGGKNIYIAKQKDGFAIAQYKRLRKNFLEIMNLNSQ
ncbi:MAG: hypothetical protein IKK99_09060 [Oscillospiraceae bacterium]|nr:hypothetical protein [Oscillospiraceae bacterium]